MYPQNDIFISLEKFILCHMIIGYKDFPGGSNGKVSAFNVGDPGSIPGSGKISWRRKWQPTPLFLPGESHGKRSLAGYNPWGIKE